jgi:F-type H+-transporting ATPase subunit alpha
MKKVAGTLKLDLASFRELEAFAQFGSDLDEGTKKQLERGKRAVEILKQPQYSPVRIEHQVAILYALTKGYIDEISIEKIKDFESGLVEYIELNAKTFMKELIENKMWTDSGEEELKIVIVDFVKNFN